MTHPVQHEPETLAAQTRKLAAAAIAQPRDLTPEETVDLMLPAAIEMASSYAEQVFLTVSGIAPLQSRRAAVEWVDRITTSHIADMMQDAGKTADELRATVEQRRRLEMGRAVLFDTRLAELQAFAILDWGHA